FQDNKRALELDPGRHPVRKRLANMYVTQSLPPEALKHFEILHRADPKDLEIRVGLAHCRFLLGQQSEAREILDGVLAEDQNFLQALSVLAKMEQLAGHYPEAEALCRRILARAPFNIEAQYTLYLCLANQDNRQKEADAQQHRYDELKKSL